VLPRSLHWMKLPHFLQLTIGVSLEERHFAQFMMNTSLDEQRKKAVPRTVRN
jgi:hypothetical protein